MKAIPARRSPPARVTRRSNLQPHEPPHRPHSRTRISNQSKLTSTPPLSTAPRILNHAKMIVASVGRARRFSSMRQTERHTDTEERRGWEMASPLHYTRPLASPDSVIARLSGCLPPILPRRCPAARLSPPQRRKPLRLWQFDICLEQVYLSLLVGWAHSLHRPPHSIARPLLARFFSKLLRSSSKMIHSHEGGGRAVGRCTYK